MLTTVGVGEEEGGGAKSGKRGGGGETEEREDVEGVYEVGGSAGYGGV